LSARETVATDSCARFATSRIVASAMIVIIGSKSGKSHVGRALQISFRSVM
jgi:hypothetical protein